MKFKKKMDDENKKIEKIREKIYEISRELDNYENEFKIFIQNNKEKESLLELKSKKKKCFYFFEVFMKIILRLDEQIGDESIRSIRKSQIVRAQKLIDETQEFYDELSKAINIIKKKKIEEELESKVISNKNIKNIQKSIQNLYLQIQEYNNIIKNEIDILNLISKSPELYKKTNIIKIMINSLEETNQLLSNSTEELLSILSNIT